MSRSEQDIFEDLAALCSEAGYIHALAYMSFRDNFIALSDNPNESPLPNIRSSSSLCRAEFSTLLGLILRQIIDTKLPTPTQMQGLLEKTDLLLNELHERLGKPMMEALCSASGLLPSDGADLPTHLFHTAEALREPIFYTGDSAYIFQYYKMAVDRYQPDDDWLLQHKGFRIADAQNVVKHLFRIQNRKATEIRGLLATQQPHLWTLLPAFIFTSSELVAESGLPANTVLAVLEAFTAAAPTNTEFTSLGSFNLATARPILQMPNGDFFVLQSYSVAESLYDSPFYWMAADKAYRETAFKNRGRFTEWFAAQRLESVFGPKNTHRNVNIDRGKTRIGEIDILICFGNRAIIVQCKSKKLSLESRKGNDNKIRDDFQKSVQDSYDQGLLCAKSLSDPGLIFSTDKCRKIDHSTFSEIYIVCAISDHYPALAIQARGFLHHYQDDVIQAPLVYDVFTIDVLTEILDNPLYFVSYINRRTTYHNRVSSGNELAIFSYHLRSNLWFGDHQNFIQIDDAFTFDLDVAMTARREGAPGKRTPEGVLTKLAGTELGSLLGSISRESNPNFIDAGLIILTLGGSALDIMNQNLHQMKNLARRDNRPLNFSMPINDEKSGITIHCRRQLGHEATQALELHCRSRKYIHRAAEWLGLLVGPDDNIPYFSIVLRFPWEHNSTLEDLTKKMHKPTVSLKF